jgi:hypothetical protein
MNYEITEPYEVGNAAELIQTPKSVVLDEVGGNEGPMHEAVEDE